MSSTFFIVLYFYSFSIVKFYHLKLQPNHETKVLLAKELIEILANFSLIVLTQICSSFKGTIFDGQRYFK